MSFSILEFANSEQPWQLLADMDISFDKIQINPEMLISKRISNLSSLKVYSYLLYGLLEYYDNFYSLNPDLYYFTFERNMIEIVPFIQQYSYIIDEKTECMWALLYMIGRYRITMHTDIRVKLFIAYSGIKYLFFDESEFMISDENPYPIIIEDLNESNLLYQELNQIAKYFMNKFKFNHINRNTKGWKTIVQLVNNYHKFDTMTRLNFVAFLIKKLSKPDIFECMNLCNNFDNVKIISNLINLNEILITYFEEISWISNNVINLLHDQYSDLNEYVFFKGLTNKTLKKSFSEISHQTIINVLNNISNPRKFILLKMHI